MKKILEAILKDKSLRRVSTLGNTISFDYKKAQFMIQFRNTGIEITQYYFGDDLLIGLLNKRTNLAGIKKQLDKEALLA